MTADPSRSIGARLHKESDRPEVRRLLCPLLLVLSVTSGCTEDKLCSGGEPIDPPITDDPFTAAKEYLLQIEGSLVVDEIEIGSPTVNGNSATVAIGDPEGATTYDELSLTKSGNGWAVVGYCGSPPN